MFNSNKKNKESIEVDKYKKAQHEIKYLRTAESEIIKQELNNNNLDDIIPLSNK